MRISTKSKKFVREKKEDEDEEEGIFLEKVEYMRKMKSTIRLDKKDMGGRREPTYYKETEMYMH